MVMRATVPEGFDIVTKPAAEIDGRERAMIFSLFDVAYRDANHAYLERSLGKLRYIALATHEGEAAGFSLGEMRVLDLPRLPQQASRWRASAVSRRSSGGAGCSARWSASAMMGAGITPGAQMLSCGRMAHPVSFRTMSSNPNAIPKRRVPITAWQQEVGTAIAAAYGTPGFDPKTLVCKGDGTIGYPVLEMDVAPEEWIVFEGVNRDRGDSLLGWCGSRMRRRGGDSPTLSS